MSVTKHFSSNQDREIGEKPKSNMLSDLGAVEVNIPSNHVRATGTGASWAGRLQTRLCAILTTLAVAAFALASGPPKFELRFFGNGTSAFAINERGDTVGWVPVSGNTRAWVAPMDQPLQILPIPAGYVSSAAYDINDSGLIVGNVSTFTHSSFSPVAAVWRRVNGQYQIELLGALKGQPYSAALAVNNLGDVVGGSGYISYGGNWRNAVHFTPEGPEPILDWTSVSEINDNRVVAAGTLQLDLDTMQVRNVGLPPGNWAGLVTNALNERNDMAGWISNWSSSCNMFPIRYLDSTGWETVGGCANQTGATAINNRRDVLTYVQNTVCRVKLEGLGDFYPSQLIDPSQGLWYVMWYGANDINDARQMLISVKDYTQTMIGAALLTPMRNGPRI